MGWLSNIFGSGGGHDSAHPRIEPSVFASGNLENPATPLSDLTGWGGLSGQPGADWIPRISETASMACSAVYRCVTLEAGVVAGLPLKIYEKKADGERVEALKHPLSSLLQNCPYPGRSLTAFSWRELWCVNLLLWGNHFSAIRYDGAGRVIGFETFMPWQVQVSRIDAKPGVNFYICSHENGITETIRQEDMIHIAGPGFDGRRGMSRIQSFARGAIGLAMTMEERTGRLHQNAAMPSGVLQTPKKMSDTGILRAKAQFDMAHRGVSKWGSTVIVDEGAKYTPFQLSPQDLQTIEARRYQIADISRFFGVPLHLLNETDKTTSWGTGLSENTLAYLIFTLDADLSRMESEINYKLFSGTEFYAEFDRDGLLSMDPVKSAQVTAQEIASGTQTINEVRKKKNRPPVEGGDIPLINSTNVPLPAQAAKVADTPVQD